MKIALLQDQLLTQGGSEQVFLFFARAFPDADIHTLAWNPETCLQEFRDFKIRTSWMNGFVRSHDIFKLAFPISTYVMEKWDLSDYDIVLSSSATIAKYASNFDCPHVCYCYFPTRAVWHVDSYFDGRPGVFGGLFIRLLNWFQRRDRAAARKVDRFLAISTVTQQEIERIYGRPSEVLPSPIDADRFAAGAAEDRGDHYLIVSRLEKWKQLEYAIDAFNELGLPLRVIGEGSEREALLRRATSPAIEFVGRVDNDQLVREYGQAKAVVFTPDLEYGLVPLEANAAGTPVIALGRRGVLETMVGLDDEQGREATAVFFSEQTPQELAAAVRRLESVEFPRERLLAHARKFHTVPFMERLREVVAETLEGRAPGAG